MNYQKIECRIWDDESFRKLSDAAKVIFFDILSNKNGNMAGMFVLRRGYIMEDTSKKEADVIKGMEEILKYDFILYDEQTAVVLIKNYLKFNPIVTPQKMVAATKFLEALPKSQLFQEFRKQLDRREIRSQGKNADLIPVVDRILTTMGIAVDSPPPEEDTASPGDPPAVVEPQKVKIEGLVDAWNQICVPVLSRVLSVHPSREAAIRARLSERSDLEEWRGIFRGIIQSPFLVGENDRGWKADFDWVMKTANLAKIIEGKYLKQTPRTQLSIPPVKTTSLWGSCKQCRKESLLANLNEDGLCFNCNPAAEEQTQRLKELLSNIGKPIPKEPSTTSSNTGTMEP